MESFVGNTRPFFQGLPTSTRGYDGSTLKDQAQAPPTPTPPATPTLPPAHGYNPYPGGLTSAAPATSLPGSLTPSRPITPATPSHKPHDHAPASSYSVTSLLHPPTSYLATLEHIRQQTAAAAAAAARPTDPLHDARVLSRPYNSQAGLAVEHPLPTRPYTTQAAQLAARSLTRPFSSQAPSSLEIQPARPYSTQPAIGADSRIPSRPYSTTHATPSNDLRAYQYPFSPQVRTSDPRVHLDSRFLERPESRTVDPRSLEPRADPRGGARPEQWGPGYRPDLKSLERLTSVHIAAPSASVNGSKDALYLGKKPEDIPSVRRPEESYSRRSSELLQVNGSRDPLYPNGSQSTFPSERQRAPSAERPKDSRPKEDSALDLSVKTVRQTPDSTAPDPEKSYSISPLNASTADKAPQNDPPRRTPNSTPVSSPYKPSSRDPSLAQYAELSKLNPGISATRATPPSHLAPHYGLSTPSSPLPSTSPLVRAAHLLPPAKRPGDPSYLDHHTKLPKLSHTPPNKSPTPSRHITEGHLSIHPRDKALYSAAREDPNRGLNLLVAATLNTEHDGRYGHEIRERKHSTERKDHSGDWRDVSLERREKGESSLDVKESERRERSLERRDLSLERRDLSIERRDPSLERRDLGIERRNASTERRDPSHERRDLSLEKRELDVKYLYPKHPDVKPPFDQYRAWVSTSEHSKPDSSAIDRPKYLPGQHSVPTSVPTTLPHQGSRVSPAQAPHPYSSYGRPPDTRLPQTQYSQLAHPISSAHHQVNAAQSSHPKIHQPYLQTPTTRASQVPATSTSSHAAEPPHSASVSQALHYPYSSSHTYSQVVAAQYHQHQQQKQQRSSQYPPFSVPPTSKPGSASLPSPHLISQQAAYAYAHQQQQRSEAHAAYVSKRQTQISPHPSVSPHPSQSPHPAASPHPSASPHPAASPHSTVSPHAPHQARVSSQYSPHPSQRPPSVSVSQHSAHSYAGTLPPSPYSGSQSHSAHTTPPSSRPSSATPQQPHTPQGLSSHPPQSSSRQSAHSTPGYPTPHLAHPSQPHLSTTAESQGKHSSQSSSLEPHSSQPHHQHPRQSQPQPPPPPAPHPSSHHPTHPYPPHSSQPYPHPHHPSQPYPPHHPSQPYPPHPQSYPLSAHSSQPYPPPPSQYHAALPHSSQPHPSAHHPPHPHAAPVHPAHPLQHHPSQSHPPSHHPSYPHPSQPHPSQTAHPASDSHPSHPSQSQPPTQSPRPPSAQAHPSQPPSHPSQPPPTHPSQTHSAHPSQPPPTHSSQPPSSHPSQTPSTHSSQPPSHPSQPPSSHPSQPPPAHPSQPPSSHPSQPPPAHPSQPPSSHPSQPLPAHPSQPPSSHSSQPPYTYPSQPPPAHPSQSPASHPSQLAPAHPSQPPASHPSQPPPAHPSQPPTSHPSQPPPAHPSQPPASHPSQPPPAHLPQPPASHPTQPPPAHPSQPSHIPSSQAPPTPTTQAPPISSSQQAPPQTSPPTQSRPSSTTSHTPSQLLLAPPTQAKPPTPSQQPPPSSQPITTSPQSHPLPPPPPPPATQSHPPPTSQSHPHPSSAPTHPPPPSTAQSHAHPSTAQSHPPTSPSHPPPPTAPSHPHPPTAQSHPHHPGAQPHPATNYPHAPQMQPPTQPPPPSTHPRPYPPSATHPPVGQSHPPTAQSTPTPSHHHPPQHHHHPHPTSPHLHHHSSKSHLPPTPSQPHMPPGQTHPPPPPHLHHPPAHSLPPASQSHPSQPYPHYPSQPYYSHPHPSQTYPPHSHAPPHSSQSHPSMPHHSSQSHPSYPHHPAGQPPQSPSHSSHAPPRSHPSHGPHLTHPHSSQMHLPQVRHPHAPHGPGMYPPHPSQHNSQPHPRPPHPSQPHAQGYPTHPQQPHYQPTQLPHPSVKAEVGSGAHYPAHYPYPTHHTGQTHDMGSSRGPALVSPPQTSGGSGKGRTPQDFDPSRIRTKGEQKAFDPRNAESGKSNANSESWPNYPASTHSAPQSQHASNQNNFNNSRPLHQPHIAGNQEAPKALDVKEEDAHKTDQNQTGSKLLEPGKAALADKLHKKLNRAESTESLVVKKEAEPPAPKKEEVPEESDPWTSGFDKLLDDLASNPEGVTSRKSKTLGARYLQKVQIQQAIDNDLIVAPIPTLEEEEEDESEPEAPIKFRGKFKSIKDKKVERVILTYASHSDESATEMIPDDDASDFEEELKREIRSKDKKRGHTKKPRRDSSSASDGDTKDSSDRRKGRRGKNKENKPNNKQDSDYSVSSNSSSDSSSSLSSSDSDSDDSESEEMVRPRRKGKLESDSDTDRKKPKRRRRKWASESSDSEEEIGRRRTRRSRKSSSDEDSYKPSRRNKKMKKKQDSSDSEELPLKTRRGKKNRKSDSDEEFMSPRRGRKKGRMASRKKKNRRRDDSDDESEEEELPRKTRGMKKKQQETKNRKRRKASSSASSSSETEEDTKAKKEIVQRKKGSKKGRKILEDSSEDSELPTKNKNHAKSSLIVDSDDSDDDSKKDNKESDNVAAKKKDIEDKKEESSEKTDVENEAKVEIPPEEDTLDLIEDFESNVENDSVIDKLKKLRNEELNREDVLEMKAWFGEVNSDIKKQLVNVQEMRYRNCWKKPQFGGGEDFHHGWQTDVKKYKELTARLPKKLCLSVKHQEASSSSKGNAKRGRDRESGKDSPSRQGSSSPAKNTRSKSGIIKTSMSLAEDAKLKVASRPEISSVMQRFFEKVLAESGNDIMSKGGLGSKKFNLGPFPAYGAQRVPTGLTPTPSVAPSMLASDDSDLDSLASIRTDLPASDSVPVSKRSIASSLLKKIGRKYNDKKLNTLCLNKPRSILEATNKPQLLPTPGMPTTEKDLEDMSPDQMKLATFFRKETVCNYRDNFEVVVTKNGINEFTPILYQSRTRTKTKQIQDAATVKSVFGADIPPHLLKKVEGKKAKKTLTKKGEKKDEGKSKGDSSPVPVSRASTPAGSLQVHGEDDDDSELRSERSESVLGESSVPSVTKKARRKFRKFRSGFDYIRKKKKVKPDDEATPSRKRLPVRKHVNWPEESRDVAAEVRSWVVNKGLGETVLHKAARLQYHDVVVYCAESPDFDINVRDNAGYTPLHEACNRGHLDIAQVLCAHGAHINAPGYKGMRPLHEAVENGHAELARLLLAYGADPMLTTYAGQTCLDLCADVQCTQLIEGFLADLKGHSGEMWHFSGPVRFSDPEEQGCDIFGMIPLSVCNKPTAEDAKVCQDAPSNPASDSVTSSIVKADEAENCQKIERMEKEETSSLPVDEKGRQNLPCKEPSLSVGEVLTGESTVKIKQEPNSEEDQVDNVVEQSLEKQLSSSEEMSKNNDEEKTEQKQESDTEEEWDVGELVFEVCELPILDTYEVEGRPHKYLLLLEILTYLKMTQAELIIAAKTIETLELSPEEFGKLAHCCIVGSCSRALVEHCSSVVLVKITPPLEKLLGIESVRI